MPYTQLFYHLVWGTKDRLSLITPELENVLYPYLTAKIRELNCRLLAMNGCEDHIHILIEIPPKYSVAEVIQRLKGSNSHEFEDLAWQRGYGAFTVGTRQISLVADYIRNQKQHHAANTILPEIENFLNEECFE